MDYYLNQQCMSEFCAHTLSLLRGNARPAASHRGSRAFGRGEAPAVLPGVTVTGSVPDVRPYARNSALMVAPLNIPRNTEQTEAMAMGVLVVTSA
jgi:hypothetical protein